MKKYNILSNAQYVDCPFDSKGNLKQGRTMGEVTVWYNYAASAGFLTPDQLCITVTYSAGTFTPITGTTLQNSLDKVVLQKTTGSSIIADSKSACFDFASSEQTYTSETHLTYFVAAETYTNLFKDAFTNNTFITQIQFNNWNTKAASENYSSMFLNAFKGCSNLTTLYLPLFNMDNLGTDPAVTDMFDGCTSLSTIHAYSTFGYEKSWANTGVDLNIPHKGVTVFNDGGVTASVFQNLDCIQPTFNLIATLPYTITSTEETIASISSNSSDVGINVRCTGSSVTSLVTLPLEVPVGDSVNILTCTCEPDHVFISFTDLGVASIDTSTNPWSVYFMYGSTRYNLGTLSHSGSNPYTLTYTNTFSGTLEIDDLTGPGIQVDIDKSNPSSWSIKRAGTPCGSINFSSTSPVSISAVSTATDLEITKLYAIDQMTYVPDLSRFNYYVWDADETSRFNWTNITPPRVEGFATIGANLSFVTQIASGAADFAIVYQNGIYPLYTASEGKMQTQAALCVPIGSEIDARIVFGGVTYSISQLVAAGGSVQLAHHVAGSPDPTPTPYYAPGESIPLEGLLGSDVQCPNPNNKIQVTDGADTLTVGYSGSSGCFLWPAILGTLPVTESITDSFTAKDSDLYFIIIN